MAFYTKFWYYHSIALIFSPSSTERKNWHQSFFPPGYLCRVKHLNRPTALLSAISRKISPGNAASGALKRLRMAAADIVFDIVVIMGVF